LAPRAPGDSVRPRRLSDVVVRPLNFTVRGPNARSARSRGSFPGSSLLRRCRGGSTFRPGRPDPLCHDQSFKLPRYQRSFVVAWLRRCGDSFYWKQESRPYSTQLDSEFAGPLWAGRTARSTQTAARWLIPIRRVPGPQLRGASGGHCAERPGKN